MLKENRINIVMAKDLQKQDVSASTVPECLENFDPQAKKYAELYALNAMLLNQCSRGLRASGRSMSLASPVHNPRVMPLCLLQSALWMHSTYTQRRSLKSGLKWHPGMWVSCYRRLGLRLGPAHKAQRRALVAWRYREEGRRTVKPKLRSRGRLKSWKNSAYYAEDTAGNRDWTLP